MTAVPVPADVLELLTEAAANLVERTGTEEYDAAIATARAACNMAAKVDRLEPAGILTPGSVLLIRRAADSPSAEQLAGLVDELARAAGHRSFTLLELDGDTAVTVLDEQAMADCGWRRIPT